MNEALNFNWHIISVFFLIIMSNRADFRPHFTEIAQQIKEGPTPNRSVNDKICLIIFIAIVLTMFILGLYAMIDQKDALGRDISNSSDDTTSNIYAIVFSNYTSIIVVGFLLAVVFAVGYILLVRYFPKCMVYTLIVAIFALMIALFIYGIVIQSFGLIIAMAIGLLFFAIFMYCMWNHIQIGIQLLQLAARFLGQKPTVYVAPVWVFFLSVVFFIFWVVSLVAIQYKADADINNGQSTSEEQGIMAFFIFTYIFMTLFFYYVLTFLIATACALWFWDLAGNYWTIGTCNLTKYHIGSLTFGAIIITVIRILKMFLSQKGQESDNFCVQCIMCCLVCILNIIEDIVEALNNTSFIAMAVTGESYCDAVKTSAYLLLDNLGLYWAVGMIGNLIMFGGIIIPVGLATLIAVAWADSRDNISSNQVDHIGVVVFFGSIILVLFLVSVLVEALDCIFVFYCLHGRLTSTGIIAPYPAILRDFSDFNGYNQQGGSSQNLRR